MQRGPAEVCIAEMSPAEVFVNKRYRVKIWAHIWMLVSPLIPFLDPLLEDFQMFRVRHCRVTSLASGMLRMILEGHTLCEPSRRVNANAAALCPPACKSTCADKAGIASAPVPPCGTKELSPAFQGWEGVVMRT